MIIAHPLLVQLSMHVDGELPPGEATALEAHLRQCALCAARGRQLQAAKTWGAQQNAALDSAGKVDEPLARGPDAVWDRVREAIDRNRSATLPRAQLPPTELPSRMARWLPLALATAAVALVAISVRVRNQVQHSVACTSPAPAAVDSAMATLREADVALRQSARADPFDPMRQRRLAQLMIDQSAYARLRARWSLALDTTRTMEP